MIQSASLFILEKLWFKNIDWKTLDIISMSGLPPLDNHEVFWKFKNGAIVWSRDCFLKRCFYCTYILARNVYPSLRRLNTAFLTNLKRLKIMASIRKNVPYLSKVHEITHCFNHHESNVTCLLYDSHPTFIPRTMLPFECALTSFVFCFRSYGLLFNWYHKWRAENCTSSWSRSPGQIQWCCFSHYSSML